jgi:hypothetical protein
MPTPVRAKNSRVLVDGYEVTGQTSGIIIDGQVGVLEWMVLQATAVEKEPNFATIVMTHNGYFFGPTAGYLYEELADRIESNDPTVVTAILGTQYPAPIAYVIPTSFAQQLRIDAPIANLMTVTGNWPVGTERAYRGYVAYYGSISATGAKTAIDLGAAGTAGGKAWLHLIGVTGSLSGAVDIDLESDTTNSFSGAETVEATFTNAARGVQAQALSGNIGRYARINTVGLGGATALQVAVIVAVNGVHY